MVVTVTQRRDTVSVLLASLVRGVTKSVQWGAMGRTVRVCVTALMVHAAITSMAAACVSRASGDPSALRGCVLMEPLACTVNRTACVTANTLSVVTH